MASGLRLTSQLIAPHAVYLVDVKSTYGEIHVAGGKWHPEGRTPFASPLAKLRQHTRMLHGLLADAAGPPTFALRHVWVEAVALLTAPDAVLRDPEGRDRDSTWKLQGCERCFMDPARLPQRTPSPVPTAPHLGQIMSALAGKARPQQDCPYSVAPGSAKSGSLATTSTPSIALECLRRKPGTSHRAGLPCGPLPAGRRNAQRNGSGIANAYQALTRLPPHPAIPAARDFFPTEKDDAYVLVLMIAGHLAARTPDEAGAAVDHGPEAAGCARIAVGAGALPRERCSASCSLAGYGCSRARRSDAARGFRFRAPGSAARQDSGP